MLGLKLNHVTKMGYSSPTLRNMESHKSIKDSWPIQTTQNLMHVSWDILYNVCQFLAAMIGVMNRSRHCEAALGEWFDMALTWHHLHNGLPWQQETTIITENKTGAYYVGTSRRCYNSLYAGCYGEIYVRILNHFWKLTQSRLLKSIHQKDKHIVNLLSQYHTNQRPSTHFLLTWYNPD